MGIENKHSSYLEMAVLGFARGAITFPLEHVFERMKLASQAHPKKTTKQAIKDLWQSQGLKGLYAGSRANFFRRTIREIYHWPVMLFINKIWKRIIPEKWNNDHLVTNIATGNSMAFVHASVTLPFERLLIEKTTNKGYLPFIKNMIGIRRFIIYEGFQATLIRHSLVWDLFYISSYASNNAFKKIDRGNFYPNLSFVGRSILTSTLVVGIGYPLEFLRNRILMEPEILSNGTLNGIKSLFHRYKGMKLYSGAPIMFLHNTIQTLFIQTLIDRINKK